MIDYKHYNTREKEKAIFTAVMGLIMLVVAVWLTLASVAEANRIKPDKVYPMVNQNIVWEGAGYNGIYAKGAEQ